MKERLQRDPSFHEVLVDVAVDCVLVSNVETGWIDQPQTDETVDQASGTREGENCRRLSFSSMVFTDSPVSIAVGWLLVGCAGNQAVIPHSVALVEQTETVPEDELLDVGVVVFDSGVPDGEIEPEELGELLRDGAFVHIRRMEAHYMAVHLRNTLQDSGHWGSVWIMPEESTAADINVSAEILHSDGSRVRLRVHAVDSTGRDWIDKDYSMATAAGSFNRQLYPRLDPY